MYINVYLYTFKSVDVYTYINIIFVYKCLFVCAYVCLHIKI